MTMDPTLVTPAQIHDNLYWSPTGSPPNIADGTFAHWQSLGGDTGTDIITNPQFVDQAAGNFKFAPDAFALTQGMTQLPFDQMGPTGGQPPPPPPPSVDTLILTLSENAYNGDAKFVAKVDGVQIGSGTVTANHADGKTQNFTFQHDWADGIRHVEVDFTNDFYGGSQLKDRNLWIDQVNYDGKNYGPASPTVLLNNGAFLIDVSSPDPTR